jgi:sigma-B regulation protein RsbU (phosphoserine phosphatase)
MSGYLDNAPCGYFSFTGEGRLQEVNDTLCALLKTSREELLGQNIENILTLPSRIFYQTHFFPLLKIQGHVEEIFITLLTKDKMQLPVLLNAQKCADDTTHRYTCAFITVHNRKRFEDELVAAKQEAERALQENETLRTVRQELQQHSKELDVQLALVNKMNADLQQFNRVISHELQEPLRKIAVFASIIKDLPLSNTDPRFYNNLEKLLRASERLKAVVSGLQQYIWLQEAPLELTMVKPGDILRAAFQKVEKEFDSATIDFSYEEMPELMADRKQLELLFYHSLCNCIKFRKKDAKACIIVRGTVLQKNLFRMVADRYSFKDFLKIDITDKGIGLDPRFKDQVFELFKRLQVTEDGKGIGLSLCKKIAENHAGYITIDGKEGEGTTLSVLLPLTN